MPFFDAWVQGGSRCASACLGNLHGVSTLHTDSVCACRDASGGTAKNRRFDIVISEVDEHRPSSQEINFTTKQMVISSFLRAVR